MKGYFIGDKYLKQSPKILEAEIWRKTIGGTMLEEILNDGMEAVDVGNLDEVRETKTLIPATKNVLFKIKKADNFVNKDNTFKMINLQLQIVNGIGDDAKYKNKVMFARVTYFADPIKYTSDFFKNKQHLVQLKYLLRSIGASTNFVIVDNNLLNELINSAPITADIIIKKDKRFIDDGTGTKMEIEELNNDIRNYKAAGASASV